MRMTIVKVMCLMFCVVQLSGCATSFMGAVGIPATEYIIREDDHHGPNVIVPVSAGLMALHGAATYGLWLVAPPAAIAYLGFSGVYGVIRVYQENN